MSKIIERIIERAKQNKKVIVLPETMDRRVLEAAEMILKYEVADLILIGKNKEIDIVVDYPDIRNILLEVKYREAAPITDNDAIVEHCDKAVAAIIITKRADDFGEHTSGNGKKLLRIPAFAFLYLLGHAEKHGYKGIK